MGVFQWKVVHPTEIPATLEVLRQHRVAESIYGELDHLEWLIAAAAAPDQELLVFALKNGADLAGCAAVLRHTVKLDFALGEATIALVPLERATIEIAPVIAWKQLGSAADNYLLDFLLQLRALVPEGAVFLSGVASHSRLGTLLVRSSELRQAFHIVQHGPTYHRRFAALGRSFEGYLGTVGKKTRKDLRRMRRRYAREFVGRYHVRSYTSAAEVDALLNDAQSISCKTYQWHLLGQGVRRGGIVERRIRAGATLGCLRSYILFFGGEPAAFQIGYRFGELYSAQETGFDPRWRNLQPGIFLLTEIFSDLANEPETALFDFQVGDSLDKRRLSSLSRRECHYYLFPRTLRGTALANAKRVVDTTSSTLGRLARTLKAEKIVRAALRSRVVSQAHAAEKR